MRILFIHFLSTGKNARGAMGQMGNKLFVLTVCGLALIFFTPPVFAQEALPGDACGSYVAGDFMRSGGPEISGGHMLVCDGANWVSVLNYADSGRTLMQVDNDAGACAAIKQGRLRYISASDQWDYCDGTTWAALGGGVPAGADTQLQFNVAGAFGANANLVYTATGNMGIGTATPNTDLELSRPLGSFPALRFTAKSVTLPNYTGSSSLGDVAFTNTIGQIRSNRGGSNSNNSGGLLVQGFTAAGVNNWKPLQLLGQQGGTAPTSAAVTISGQKSNGGNNRAGLVGSEPVLDVESVYDVSNALLFRIQGNGNVGIGTASPVAKLDVNGEIKFSSAGLACGATTEGAQRYNSTSKAMEFCNGTAWGGFGGSTFSFDVERALVHSGGAVWVPINFTTENVDTNNVFDILTDRFQPTVAGDYFIAATGYQDNCSLNENAALAIYKNGVLYRQTWQTTAINVGKGSMGVTAILLLNGSTDYVELRGWENCTGVGGIASSSLSGHKINP